MLSPGVIPRHCCRSSSSLYSHNPRPWSLCPPLLPCTHRHTTSPPARPEKPRSSTNEHWTKSPPRSTHAVTRCHRRCRYAPGPSAFLTRGPCSSASPPPRATSASGKRTYMTWHDLNLKCRMTLLNAPTMPRLRRSLLPSSLSTGCHAESYNRLAFVCLCSCLPVSVLSLCLPVHCVCLHSCLSVWNQLASVRLCLCLRRWSSACRDPMAVRTLGRDRRPCCKAVSASATAPRRLDPIGGRGGGTGGRGGGKGGRSVWSVRQGSVRVSNRSKRRLEAA